MSGDMDEALRPTQVYECAEVPVGGDVPFSHIPFPQLVQQARPLRRSPLLPRLPLRQYGAAAGRLHFQHLQRQS